MEVHAVQVPGQTLRMESLAFWLDMCTTGFYPAAEADIGFPQKYMGNPDFGFLGRYPRPSFFLLSVLLAHAAISSSSNGVRIQPELLQELRLALQSGNTFGIHLEYRGHDDYSSTSSWNFDS